MDAVELVVKYTLMAIDIAEGQEASMSGAKSISFAVWLQLYGRRYGIPDI
jgi:hypothetical protein